jgi:hypothetical protein
MCRSVVPQPGAHGTLPPGRKSYELDGRTEIIIDPSTTALVPQFKLLDAEISSTLAAQDSTEATIRA